MHERQQHFASIIFLYCVENKGYDNFIAYLESFGDGVKKVKKHNKYNRWNLVLSIIQIIIGLMGVTSFIILAVSGEKMGKWFPALALAVALIIGIATSIHKE